MPVSDFHECFAKAGEETKTINLLINIHFQLRRGINLKEMNLLGQNFWIVGRLVLKLEDLLEAHLIPFLHQGD